MKSIFTFIICAFFVSIVKGQDQVTTDPDSATIITTDINNFWRAFDLLKDQKTLEDSLKIIKTFFTDKATEGLRLFI